MSAPLDEARPPVVEGLQIATYRIGRLLGKGGLGYVYAAVDLRQHSPVAIKILRPDRLHAKDGFYRDLFRNEAQIGSALNHPRIVKLLASGEYNDLPSHVFEYVDDGMWLLDSNHDGIPEQPISFGQPGDHPLAGDFDGDGTAELAVLRQAATGLLTWQIDVNGDSNWDETVTFGSADDIPILGYWNGDGRDDLGTFRRDLASHGVNTWLLKGIGQQSDDREILFGLSGDQPLVADWNGDGRSDIGAVRSMPEVDSFLLDLDFDLASERFVHFGLPGDIPIAFMTSSLPVAERQPSSTE